MLLKTAAKQANQHPSSFQPDSVSNFHLGTTAANCPIYLGSK